MPESQHAMRERILTEPSDDDVTRVSEELADEVLASVPSDARVVPLRQLPSTTARTCEILDTGVRVMVTRKAALTSVKADVMFEVPDA